MIPHPYILEPYRGKRTRFPCPACKQPGEFTRYIDTETGEYISPQVGKCNRANNCGYHYPPAEYFRDQPETSTGINQPPRPSRTKPRSTPPPAKVRQYLPRELFDKSREPARMEGNHLHIYLRSLFGADLTEGLLNRFKVGSTSSPWPGSCVFWNIDETGGICGGQVVDFDPRTGHTVKEPPGQNGKQKRRTNWVNWPLTNNLHRHGKEIPGWLKKYNDSAPRWPVPFGLPQLLTEPNTKPIAIVEAPKTAIICTAYLPEFIWLAIGALSWLNPERLKPIQGREIILFPDRGALTQWKEKTADLARIGRVGISSYLETVEAPGLPAGADLADLLTLDRDQDFGWAMAPGGYPLLWDWPAIGAALLPAIPDEAPADPPPATGAKPQPAGPAPGNHWVKPTQNRVCSKYSRVDN